MSKDKHKDKAGARDLAAQEGAPVPREPREARDHEKGRYESQLKELQVELNGLMEVLAGHGERVLVLFEGRDTSGKGGVIHAIAERLNPRQCHVVALGVPSHREQSQWYFQRYVPSLPAAGEMVLFDRSWYNRAGVEVVMGFCTAAQTKAFLAQAPVFEKMLVDDGIRLFKYWLTVDQAVQEQRFADRLSDPLKRWKLSPVDLQARRLYAEYGRARDRMLEATHTDWAPWTLVNFNDQHAGRLTLIRDLLRRLPRHAPSAAASELEMPPLPGPPLKETIHGPWPVL